MDKRTTDEVVEALEWYASAETWGVGGLAGPERARAALTALRSAPPAEEGEPNCDDCAAAQANVDLNGVRDALQAQLAEREEQLRLSMRKVKELQDTEDRREQTIDKLEAEVRAAGIGNGCPACRRALEKAEAQLAETQSHLDTLNAAGLSMTAAYPDILNRQAVTDVARAMEENRQKEEMAWWKDLEAQLAEKDQRIEELEATNEHLNKIACEYHADAMNAEKALRVAEEEARSPEVAALIEQARKVDHAFNPAGLEEQDPNKGPAENMRRLTEEGRHG